MGRTQETQQQSPEDETKTFWKKLRSLRESLLPEQREALDAILANAAKAAILAKAASSTTARGAATDQTSETMALATALATFRDKLAPHERDAFEALLAAGAMQGAADGDAVVYLVVAIVLIGLGPPFGLFVAGQIGLLLDEVEGEAADLSGIPPSPEEPD